MSSPAPLPRRVATSFYGDFPELRPIQEAALQPILEGRNVVLSSGTGSGKTEAVVAPLVARHWPHVSVAQDLAFLYIAPTKALANDLEKRLETPLRKLGLQVGIRHGDRDDLVSGSAPHLLITTPESLEVLLVRKEPALKTVRAVVLDEAHLLHNTQRGLQVAILLRRLRRHTDNPFQLAALSATIGCMESLRDFLFGSRDDAALLAAAGNRVIDARVIGVAGGHEFVDVVLRLTGNPHSKLLVFANSRRECEELVSWLGGEARLRDCVLAHYSSLSTEVRLDVERTFAHLDSAICVATSTLELGIDIGDIDAVLLWGPPNSLESFLQRIGRGCRRSHKTNVVCLVPPTSPDPVHDALLFLGLVAMAKSGQMPARRPYELFGAVGQQCLSAIHSAEETYVRVADLAELCTHRPYLDRPVVESVLAALAQRGYVQAHGYMNRYAPDAGLHRLVDYRMIYGNFAAGSQELRVTYGAKTLGFVPASNLLRIRIGDRVRFAAQAWAVRRASVEGFELEPVQSRAGLVDFTYGGRVPGTDPYVLGRVWALLHGGRLPTELLGASLRQSVRQHTAQLRSCCAAHQVPHRETPNGHVYLTYAGAIVNKAVALITGQTAYSAGDVALTTSKPVRWTSLPTEPSDFRPIFAQLFDANPDRSVYQELLPADLQLREESQSWLCDEAIASALERLAEADTVPMPPELRIVV